MSEGDTIKGIFERITEEPLTNEEVMLMPYLQGDKVGYRCLFQGVRIEAKFDNARSFSEKERLASVSINGKWGFINSDGDFVIEPIFDNAHDFSEGLAGIMLGGQIPSDEEIEKQKEELSYLDKLLGGLLDYKKIPGIELSEKQEKAQKKQQEKIVSDHKKMLDKMYQTKQKGLWGYVNSKGKTIIEPKYKNIDNFSEKVASVLKNEKWGAIDKKGNTVIPFQYDYLGSFNQGYALCVKDKNLKEGEHPLIGVINKQNKIIIPFEYIEISYYSEGLFAVSKNDKWGFLDNKGKETIPLIYEKASSFSEGFASVKVNEKYGAIDKAGKMIIEAQFDNPFSFTKEENGEIRAFVLVDEKSYYLRPDGELYDPMDAYKEIEKQASENDSQKISFETTNAEIEEKIQGDIAFTKMYRNLSLLEDERPETLDEASVKHDIAVKLAQAGRTKKAIELFKDSLTQYQKELGNEDNATMKILGSLAATQGSFGLFKEARSSLEEVLKTNKKQAETKENNFQISITLNSIALILLQVEDYSEAKAYLKEALKFRNKAKADNNTLLLNLGEVYKQERNYKKAEEFNKQVIEQLDKKELKDTKASLLKGIVWSNQGEIFIETKRLDKAEKALKKALKIQEKSIGKQHSDFATSSINLGRVYLLTKDYGKAKKFLEQGKKINEKELSNRQPMLAWTYKHTAQLYIALGKKEEAKILLEKALKIRETVIGKINKGNTELIEILEKLNL